MSKDLLDIQLIRKQFPVLDQKVHKKKIIYFDNAATTQVPQCVMDQFLYHYQHNNANVHRSIHTLSVRATLGFENTRAYIQKFIHSQHIEEIIFTKSTTEGINLVATSYGEIHVQEGDEVLVSHMEHHSNLIPWQRLCHKKKAYFKIISINDEGVLNMADFDKLITKRTKIVAISYMSNTIGTINPIKEIIEKAHAYGAIVVIDAAQAIAHVPINVMDLDCDFFAFSAHKAYGLTGVGCLYGKKQLLEQMLPYQSGGEMIQHVTLQHTTYADIPYKFEAGTPPIASVIAWQAALHFIEEIGYENIIAHEQRLLNYIYNELKQINRIQFFGPTTNKIGILAFLIEDLHHLDVGLLLDAQGIAVRTGHCCTQPLMDRFGIEGIVRISFAIYNSEEEVSRCISAIKKIAK